MGDRLKKLIEEMSPVARQCVFDAVTALQGMYVKLALLRVFGVPAPEKLEISIHTDCKTAVEVEAYWKAAGLDLFDDKVLDDVSVLRAPCKTPDMEHITVTLRGLRKKP
jgi:hypothetical protein